MTEVHDDNDYRWRQALPAHKALIGEAARFLVALPLSDGEKRLAEASALIERLAAALATAAADVRAADNVAGRLADNDQMDWLREDHADLER